MRAELSHEMKLFLHQYWQDIGTPLALRLDFLLQQEKFDELAGLLDIDNSSIRDPVRLAKARACVDILKKADYLPTSHDRARAAIEKWAWAEKKCRQTNLEVWYASVRHAKANDLLISLLPRVRFLMKKFLGPIPDLENIFGGFGPGATLSNTRAQSSTLYKLQIDTPTVTSGALWFVPALPRRLQNLWFANNGTGEIREAGRLELVPKSYKTDRPIMVEPLVNAAIQRHFGLAIKRRLRTLGVDLSVAPDVHKKLAREGSISGDWATIDLSAASDTIAFNLVEAILPEDWFRCLNACRTHQVDLGEYACVYSEVLAEYGIRDDVVTLNKFSSMGNGFSFELETMIFFAICVAASDFMSVAGVNGDDIIVKSEVAEDVICALEAFGFTINKEKSFYKLTRFRESCGGDYLCGVEVKGVTLKTEPRTPMDWMDIHNRIWLLQARSSWFDFTRTLLFCKNRVPRRLRFNIPARLGTGGFFSEIPYLRPKIVDGIYYYKSLTSISKYSESWVSDYKPDVILAAMLLGGVATKDQGVHDMNVMVNRENGLLLGPALYCYKPEFRIAWVPCS